MAGATASPSTAAVRARLAAALTARSEHVVARSEQVLTVHPALEGVVPHGLVRGVSLACIGPAAASAAALVVAGPTVAGSWACVVGYPELGVAAWSEAGVAVERVVLVRSSGAADDREAGDRNASDRSDGDVRWGKALAAAIDGFDLVVVGPQVVSRLRPSTARQVQARAQARGVVLVVVGDPGPFAADLRLHATAQWHGLGSGHGHLRAREVRLALGGRRMPRGRRDTIWFPGPSGQIERFGAGSAMLPLRRTG